jgi:hypothetical protein
MKLIISEKASVANQLIKSGLLSSSDQITFTFSLGLWTESKVKIDFNQVPYTDHSGEMRSLHETFFKKGNESWGNEKNLIIDGSGATILKQNLNSDGLNKLLSHLNGHIHQYTDIIIATDNDRRGAYGALQIIERLKPSKLPINVMLFSDTSLETIKKSWLKRNEYSWVSSGYEKKANAQKVKKAFDFWWHTNSALVFGECLKKSGLRGDPVLSKYEFMAINVLSNHEHKLTTDKLIDIMASWEGTGRYSSLANNYECQIGSASSQSEIVSRLIERGVFKLSELNGVKSKALSLTPEGERFLEFIHPKTFDKDLPFRLYQWCFDENINAIRRYINTLFSRQLRFQRNK